MEVLVVKITFRWKLARKQNCTLVLTGELTWLCTFFSINKPGSSMVSLKAGNNACSLVKLEKAHNLMLLLGVVEIVYNLV